LIESLQLDPKGEVKKEIEKECNRLLRLSLNEKQDKKEGLVINLRDDLFDLAYTIESDVKKPPRKRLPCQFSKGSKVRGLAATHYNSTQDSRSNITTPKKLAHGSYIQKFGEKHIKDKGNSLDYKHSDSFQVKKNNESVIYID